MRDIGKNLKQLRERKNMKQEDLAELLFVTRQTVSNYENGRSRPDIETLIKIAELLETDVNCILYGPPVPEDKKEEQRRLLIAVAVTGLLWVFCFGFPSILTYLDRPIYVYDEPIVALYFLQGYFGAPIFCLVSGWTLFCGLGYFGYAKQMEQPWVKYGRQILVLLLSLALLCLLPAALSCIQTMIPPLADVEIPILIFLNEHTFSIMFKIVQFRYIAILLGGLLWLFGVPRGKSKTVSK